SAQDGQQPDSPRDRRHHCQPRG
ncbi:hypothetical protein BN1723_019398, partial [Verticillium longisporum]